MAYEMKDGDLSLFRNDKKEPGSKQPDMRGTMMWNGQKLKISAWTKGEGDRRFLSGRVEIDDYVPASTPSPAGKVEDAQVINDDLPF